MERPLLVVTTTLPVAVPAGIVATILVSFQLLTFSNCPPMTTCPGEAPKLDPEIVTWVPTGPETGVMLVIVGMLTMAKVGEFNVYPRTEI
jgi:hypothetical protein